MSATRVVRREPSGATVDYVALIGREDTLVRYLSVIEPDRYYDVVRVPHGGEPEWIDEWYLAWSDEAREQLLADVRALPRD